MNPLFFYSLNLYFALLEFIIIVANEVNNVLAVESHYPLIAWINFHTMSIGFRGDE